MDVLFDKNIKTDLNKLERPNKGSGNQAPVTRTSRRTVQAVTGSSDGERSAAGNANASGLESPLTMKVTLTKTVSIDVPSGATAIDVQVVQKYTLTDASGEEFEVTVEDYP